MGKLTPELKRVLKLQYPEDVILEIRGEIVHFKDIEENWRKLGNFLGLEVFKEECGNNNWVLYNPKNFKVDGKNYIFAYLMCTSDENLELPINCSSCNAMFSDFKFNSKNALKDFDTSEVKDMICMFENCTFPDGFSLGDKFDTSKVESMSSMFRDCHLPVGFSLGNKFNTSNVKDTSHMFDNCFLPDGFSLGDKFDTSNIIGMTGMFDGCLISKGFSLGNKFNTSNAKYMGYMFANSTFQGEFSLGDKFSTSNVQSMEYMFANITFPDDFYLEDKFNISNVELIGSMFCRCELPEGKTVNDFDCDYDEIVEWLKSRNPKNLGKTGNTNFFN